MPEKIYWFQTKSTGQNFEIYWSDLSDLSHVWYGVKCNGTLPWLSATLRKENDFSDFLFASLDDVFLQNGFYSQRKKIYSLNSPVLIREAKLLMAESFNLKMYDPV